MPLEFNPLRIHNNTKRSRRRSAAQSPAAPDLETILIERIDAVNARAARREADARREQEELIRLLRWSLRLVEVSKARAVAQQQQPAAVLAEALGEDADDADYR